jgi:tight adherence protein B
MKLSLAIGIVLLFVSIMLLVSCLNVKIVPTQRADYKQWLIGCCIFLLVGAVMKNISFGLLSTCIYLAAPWIRRKVKLNHERRELGFQIVDALSLLSNSLRAGLTLTQAMHNLADELPDPLGREFRTLVNEMSFGCSLDIALTNLSKRVAHEDLDLAITAILVQRQTGGNLASVLITLAATVRDRQKVDEKLKTATAQGKLTGAVIVCLPPAMAIVINIMQPGFFRPMLNSSIGVILLVLGLVMDIAGGLAIRRICEIHF